jgi:hypothetical protein
VKIPATLQPLLPPGKAEIPSLIKQLQVGQILLARVTGAPQPGLLKLQIANTELLARSQVQATEGSRLKLQVTQREPMPELKVLRDPSVRDVQVRAIKTALSRQMPPAEVRQSLGEIRQQPMGQKTTELVRQFTSILQTSGLKPDQLTAPMIRQAVNQSGILHEARLAGHAPPLPPTAAADTKSGLLQILAQIAPELALKQRQSSEGVRNFTMDATLRQAGNDSLLGRLIRLVEGAVSRVQLQQSAALPIDESPRQAWQLDLPIQLADETSEAMLRIEREDATEHVTDPTWSVNIAFQFDTIGTLQCRVALAGERVSTTFWCEKAQTHARVENRLPVLRDALEAQGLEVVHLVGVLGDPPEPLINIPRPETLLDERA